VRRGDGAVAQVGTAAWWQWGRVPGLAAGLLLLEWGLAGAAGAPTEQLRVLGRLVLAPTDPVAPVLAALALIAEVLAGYLLALLVLRSLSLLPGSLGRLTGRALLLASPQTLHRLLDLLVGGALLAQVTLVTMPGSSSGRGLTAVHHPTAPAPAACSRPAELGCGSGPMQARPSPRRSAAPLPPWLEGGPSNATRRHTVREGDTLWEIAASHLAPAERSLPRVNRYWQRIYRANRSAIGADPDLIRPGTHLEVPVPGDDHP
jgi:nucleoid-associated protein YgaU